MLTESKIRIQGIRVSHGRASRGRSAEAGGEAAVADRPELKVNILFESG